MNVASPTAPSREVGPLPRVLIVDDSRMVRASLIRHIRERYDFREEADGEAGWQALVVDHSIHVVISDLSMPRLDGFELLQRIRASNLPRVRDVPVIIISGDEDDEARAKAKTLGASDFITKGIGTVELLARIESAVRFSNQARELAASRAAAASKAPVDEQSGLPTPQFLHMHGDQVLSAAKRHDHETSALLVSIDNFARVERLFSRMVADLVMRKLAKMMALRVRKEDVLAQVGDGQFAIIAPNMDMPAAGVFAERLRTLIANTGMQYRGEVIRLSLSIGLANNRADNCHTVSQLIGLAAQRASACAEEGGNRTASSGGEAERRVWSSGLASIERALLLISAGDPDAVRPILPELMRRVLPLLQMAATEFQIAMPLEAIERALAGKE
ncbi:MAG: response regulator [Rhodocyclaceae bacterium]|nr:response regulator [Rhodocyclaceae bacterium]MBX3670907.1 response regulator [Rhodocyclaceae bacterium]